MLHTHRATAHHSCLPLISCFTSVTFLLLFSSTSLLFFSVHLTGAQIWYDQLVHQLQWNTVAVMPDSYAGVFPPGAIGPLFREFNFCSAGFLSEALQKKCLSGELTNMDVVTEYLAKSPTVPVAYLQVSRERERERRAETAWVGG